MSQTSQHEVEFEEGDAVLHRNGAGIVREIQENSGYGPTVVINMKVGSGGDLHTTPSSCKKLDDVTDEVFN